MKKLKLRNFAIALLGAGLMTQAQAAAPEPLTPEVSSSIAAMQTACAQLRYDQVLLDISRAINDPSGVSANLTTIRTDQLALRDARQALAAAGQAYLRSAQEAFAAADTAYDAAFTQLKADAINNPGAIPADQANVLSAYTALDAARAQVRANLQSLAGAGAFTVCADGPGVGIGDAYGNGPGFRQPDGFGNGRGPGQGNGYGQGVGLGVHR